MNVKEFFEKAKLICEYNADKECPCCILDEFCAGGFLAMSSEKAERVIEAVRDFQLD